MNRQAVYRVTEDYGTRFFNFHNFFKYNPVGDLTFL